MKLIYAESARQDIHEIYVTISARGSTSAAGRVENHIRHRCEMLAEFPFASSKTDEVRMRRAALVRYPYAIFFRVDPDRTAVEIARVVHGASLKDFDVMPDSD